MVRFPLAKVLLPAVLVSASIFTMLTLPFVLTRSRPIVIELSPLFSGEIEPIFSPERKDFAIRYLGFVIVISVGAGLITAEMLRKTHSTREFAETKEQLSGLQKKVQEQEAELAAAKLLGIDPQELEAIAAEFSNPDFARSVAAKIMLTTDEPSQTFDSLDAISHQSPAMIPENEIAALTPAAESLALEPFSQPITSIDDLENGAIASNGAEPTHTSELKNGHLASELSVQEFHTYQRCYVRLPAIDQQRFALRVNGRYYTLFRSSKTNQQVQAIAERLQQKGSEVLITLMQDEYAVWRFEPEADLQSVS